ncbi:hypothetical protein [Streptomyces sp. ME19-01-6]|nr:hypothetical protein [Streptomyces sp. ME19-01-6]MDX3232642.1 hypothetical protein [Streptomyces sp. ME19-01-6]
MEVAALFPEIVPFRRGATGPVLQLYAADVPDLPFPPGTDLLQLLWCA